MQSSPALPARRAGLVDRALVPGIAALAAVQLITAGWILLAPHAFFRQVAAFGVYNGHMLADSGAMTAGVGLALAAALRWPVLRAGALAANVAFIGVHAINHWADVNDAHPGSNAGIADAVSLTILFAFAAVLLRAALRSPSP